MSLAQKNMRLGKMVRNREEVQRGRKVVLITMTINLNLKQNLIETKAKVQEEAKSERETFLRLTLAKM
jgi:hypothetical protein